MPCCRGIGVKAGIPSPLLHYGNKRYESGFHSYMGVQDMILSKEQIFQAQDIATDVVTCPEWGGDVTIRALTLAQAQEWRRSSLTKTVIRDKDGKPSTEYIVDHDKLLTSDVRLMITACVDQAGNPLFTRDDIDALMKKSPGPVTRIVKAIVEISGLRADVIEETEKNCVPSPNGSSSSE